MQEELQAHIAFHLTGKRLGSRLDPIEGLGLRPALLAGYSDLTRLRYDFPLVLISDRAAEVSVQSLSGLMDGLLKAVATGADGERLRHHAVSLEQEIRAVAAEGTSGTLQTLWDAAARRLTGHNDELLQDSLRRLRAALKIDGEVVDCDKSMPFRLLLHVWTILRDRKTERVRNAIDDLTRKLGDILKSDFVHSDEGLSEQRLMASLGPSQRDAFDFAAMSHLLTQSSVKTPLPEGRRRRIEGLLSVLKAQRFFPATGSGGKMDQAPAYEFVFDSCAEAMAAFRARRSDMVELAKALAIAELEVDGRYNGSKHNELFEDFGANGLDAAERALFPDYLLRVDTDEISGALKAVAAGLPAKILVQSDDLLESATVDGGQLALALGTRQLATTAIGLNSVYVLQASSSNLLQLRDQICRGLAFEGPALFNVFSGASTNAIDVPPYLLAAAATESRVFPAFVYDPSAGPDLASRVSFDANPQRDVDWPTQSFAYEDEDHQQISERMPFTLIDFVACDRRYARHFARVARAGWNGHLASVAEFLGAVPGDLTDKVPYQLMVDNKNTLQKVIVDETLIHEARQCASMWHGLQELCGVNNSHAARLLAEERKVWAEQMQLAQGKPGVDAPKTAGEDVAMAAAVVAAVPQPVAAEPSPDGAYIETPRCSTCEECVQINNKMFAYDDNKQAYIADLKAGTYSQLVEAAESCQVAVIHPGKPWNPNEPNLDELIKRAEPFM